MLVLFFFLTVVRKDEYNKFIQKKESLYSRFVLLRLFSLNLLEEEKLHHDGDLQGDSKRVLLY